MNIEKVHSKFGDFIKDDEGNNDVYRQILIENTDKDVMIDDIQKNMELPSDIKSLDDLIRRLSKYSMKRDNVGLVSKYHGNGEPTNVDGAEKGDIYIDDTTGIVYEYHGSEDEYDGNQKIDLINSFLMTQSTSNETNITVSNIQSTISGMFDNSSTTIGNIPASRRIVFDLGEPTDISKIRLSFDGFTGYYQNVVVAVSNDIPKSTTSGQAHGMTWTKIISGNRALVSYITSSSNTIKDGTGTVEFTIPSGNCLYRYISIYMDINYTASIADFSVYKMVDTSASISGWHPLFESTFIVASSLPDEAQTGTICLVKED